MDASYLRKIVQCFVISAVVLTTVGLLHADEDMGLSEALSDFYKNNYDILISKYEIDKSYGDYIGSRLLPNPDLSFNYSFISLQDFPKATDNTQTVTRIDQLIELGGKRGLRTDAASATLDAAKLTQKDTVRTLLIGFYTLFYNSNADILNAKLAHDELERFDKTLAIADKKHAAGFLSLVDYTKLKLVRIDLQNALSTAEAQLKNDIEQFGMLLGSATPRQPALLVREDFKNYTEEELIWSAEQYRYDLLSIEKQLQASELSQRLAKAQVIPDITAGVEFDTIGVRNTPGLGFGFSVPLPIFNRNQGEIARRKAEYSQLETQREKIKRQIVSDIRLSLNNYVMSTKIFDTYKSKKREMEDLMSRSEQAFSLGGITVLDLLDTEKTYREFMSKYNQALVQGNLNGALLKVYTGGIE